MFEGARIQGIGGLPETGWGSAEEDSEGDALSASRTSLVERGKQDIEISSRLKEKVKAI